MEAAAYTRISSQAGVKIGRKVGKLGWHIKPYVDFLFVGNKPDYSVNPDIEGAVSETIYATDENAASFGLGAGANLSVSPAVNLFANADIKMNADYFGYQTNVGAAFKF